MRPQCLDRGPAQITASRRLLVIRHVTFFYGLDTFQEASYANFPNSGYATCAFKAPLLSLGTKVWGVDAKRLLSEWAKYSGEGQIGYDFRLAVSYQAAMSEITP